MKRKMPAGGRAGTIADIVWARESEGKAARTERK